MADRSTPLLLSQTDDEHEKANSQFTLNKIIEHGLSTFGFSQFVQTILVGLPLFFDSQLVFITVFTDAYPKWHCLDRTICDSTASNICELPRSAWDWDGGFKGKSVISDFGLECSSSLLRGLLTSAFYGGCVVGGFLLVMIPEAFLGRKKLLLISTLTMSIIGMATSISPNVWIYASLRFLNGFARSLITSYSVVLISERLSTKWRLWAGMIPLTLFVLGFMSLSGIAYVMRNSSWRLLYLCASIPAVLYCIVLHVFTLESPRWLYLRGRREEAVNVLRKCSRMNKADLDSLLYKLPLKQETEEQGPRNSIKDLLVRRWAFLRILAVMIISFGIGMSYYGVPLAVRDINVNIYVGEALSALVELPSFVLSPILLEKFSRKSSFLVNNLIGGISGILCSVLSVVGRTTVSFGFELACFFSARMSFNLLIVYVVEMFPTSVRNSATTMMRQAVMIGGVCGPMIVSLGQNIPWLSFGIFGFGLLVFGLFVLVLPETKGSSLCDTMEEQEQKMP